MTDIHPIRSDDDLASAIAEIDSLWDAPAGSPERDRLDVLSILVEAYESRFHPVPEADPIEILLFAIEDMGHSQAELGEVLGSRSRASEVLNRKRALNLDMIRRISEAWHIPIAALAKPYPVLPERELGPV
ncbi:MAG TPA: transcriptional regulator [Beijerinckiaceae bacterium]|jgi:HTH-type transcriptional regulator/antitoxin HigA|nr:transcriptional regulator [Beijerinckiaceae bacterium]